MIHCEFPFPFLSSFKSTHQLVALVVGLALILSVPVPSHAVNAETAELMFKATKLSLEGKNKEALEIFMDIARKEPKNFYAHNNVAMVYIELKEYDKALEAYETSLALNPTFPMVLNNIGHLHMTLGHYDKAEKYLKKSLGLFKTLHLASANLGELYLKQKRYDEAMKYLQRALTDMPTLARVHQLLGQLHRAQGREDEAEKEFVLYEKLRLKPDKKSP